MPTTTYTPIASTTLTGTQTTVTFSSIPGTYRDLIVIISALASNNVSSPYLTINADTGANYNRVRMSGDGASTFSNAQTGQTSALLRYQGGISNTTPTPIIIDFLDYSATDKHKTFLSKCQNAAAATDITAHRWASTSAITTLAFDLGGLNWAAGSTFSLYGVIA